MNSFTPRAIALLLAVAVALVLSSSCDEKKGTGATHQITGKLSDSSGKPVSNVKIAVFGYPHGIHESFSKVVEIVGPADRYSVDVPEGTYDAPRGSIAATYNGRNYVLPLASADNTKDWGNPRDSKSGLTRDFVWRISGPKPEGVGNPQDQTGHWGAAVNLDKGADVGDFGTIEVTLTPDGPLIDGSQGKPLTFKRVIPWQKHEDHLLLDIPIGRYTASAKITSSGSDRAKPLSLIVTSGNPMKVDVNAAQSTASSVVIEFEQAEPRPGQVIEPGQEPKLYVPSLFVFPEKGRRGAF